MKETESVERGQKRKEFIRFCIVGVVATLIQYAVYYLVQLMSDSSLWLNLSYTVGYVVSLVCNFFMTTYFTFRSRVSLKNVAGFGGSHLVNYLIHMVLFNTFISIGIDKVIAPWFVFAVAVPVNFTLLHFVYKNKRSKEN